MVTTVVERIQYRKAFGGLAQSAILKERFEAIVYLAALFLGKGHLALEREGIVTRHARACSNGGKMPGMGSFLQMPAHPSIIN